MAKIIVRFLAREINLAFLGIAAAVVISLLLAPKDKYFLPNAMFYLLSQLVALAFLLPFKPRPAVVGGVAAALAVYLAAFAAWLFSRQHPESMAWLGYVFSLPRAVVGGIFGLFLLRRYPVLGVLAVAGYAAGFSLIGVMAGQIVICSTIMYCLGG